MQSMGIAMSGHLKMLVAGYLSEAKVMVWFCYIIQVIVM